MEKILDALIGLLQRMKRLDRRESQKEARDLAQHLLRQIFNQIPAVSGAAGLLAGGWVASTFTTSPWKAALARYGVVKGGKHVVSGLTYKFLSVGLPMLSVAVAGYLVQKALRRYRDVRMERDMRRVARSGAEIQEAVRERLGVLDKALELGLVSASEHRTKKADLYASCSRVLPPSVRQLIASKLA